MNTLKPLLIAVIALGPLRAVETAPPAIETGVLVSTLQVDGGLSVEPIQEEHVPFEIQHPEGADIKALYAKVEKGRIAWKTLPEKHYKRYVTYTVMSAPPGDYLITIGGSKLIKVTGKEQGDQDFDDFDDDPPDPKPDPKPEPIPDGEFDVAWAVWVYEKDNLANTVSEAIVMKDMRTEQYLDGRQIQRRIYEKDQQASGRYMSLVDKLPALILISRDGKANKSFPAPTSVESMKKLVEGVDK